VSKGLPRNDLEHLLLRVKAGKRCRLLLNQEWRRYTELERTGYSCTL